MHRLATINEHDQRPTNQPCHDMVYYSMRLWL